MIDSLILFLAAAVVVGVVFTFAALAADAVEKWKGD